jgi:hypothetical protein
MTDTVKVRCTTTGARLEAQRFLPYAEPPSWPEGVYRTTPRSFLHSEGQGTALRKTVEQFWLGSVELGPGSWVVSGPDGRRWAMTDAEFELLFKTTETEGA